MRKIKTFEKPIGFRDILPEIASKKRVMENKLQALFSKWGYQEMQTTTLEYIDVVGKASAISDNKMFKLLDRQGNTLVLRPDMTAPIARAVSSVIRDQEWPIRISYHSNVFRAQEHEAGRAAEFFQSGIELIGEGVPDADAEILALAIESLKKLEIGNFRLVIGHTSYLNGILEEWVNEKQTRESLRLFLTERNVVGYRELVKENINNQQAKDALLALLNLQGDASILEVASSNTNSQLAKQSVEECLAVYNLLKMYGVEEHISFDFTFVPHLEYYTGMVFEGTVEEIGFPVCSGGRYNSLLDAFDNPKAATGFALNIDRILDVSKIDSLTTNKLKVIYNIEHQEEALSYVVKLRSESDNIVETHRVEYEEDKRMFVNQAEEQNDTEYLFFLGEEEA